MPYYPARTTYGNQLFFPALGIFLGIGLLTGLISLIIYIVNKKNKKKGGAVKVQRGFAIVGNIFFSLFLLILGTFNYYYWYVGAILITLLMALHMGLTFKDWKKCCGGQKRKTFLGLFLSGMVILVIIFVACYLLSGICFGFHPDEFSFVGSRAYNDQCANYAPKPCHFYLLFGKNVSSDINVIFHSYKRYTSPVLWFSVDGETWDSVPAETQYFSLLAPFTYRYIYYAYLLNLNPDSTYYLQVGDSSDPASVSDVKKFKTGPADHSDFTFAIGGDVGCEAPYPEMTSKQVASRDDVLFLVIGGDIAYANGLPGCYWRWDTLLFMWEKTLITPSNYTIPFLFSIGNHEAGVAWGSYDKKTAPYYFYYLPFEPLNGRSPYDLDSFHYHVIGNNTVLYSLDSEITFSSDEQVAWMKDLMGTVHADLPNKLAVYHVPLYPGSRSITTLPIPHLRDVWLPVFDEFHLKVAFENHDHVFLRSKIMLADKENENGTLYIGDGAFGVVGELAADTPTRPYVVHAEDIRHFMFVEVSLNVVNITVIAYDGTFLDNVVRT